MERDMSVTVTRESRVSHATTTTPHHTIFPVKASCIPTVSSPPAWLPRRPAPLAASCKTSGVE